MLPRTLSTSLRRTTSTTLAEPCVACTCRCGAPLNRLETPNHNGGRGLQKRYMHASQQRQDRYQTSRKSPSTMSKLVTRERYVLTPEEARKRRGLENSLLIEKFVEKFVEAGGISVSTEAAMGFVRAFEELLGKARGRPSVEPEPFIKIKDEYGLSGSDCFQLARLCLTGRQEERFTGRKLFISLSRAGDVEATIYVMANAVQQQRTKPTTLRSMEVQYAKAHLAKVADGGKNYRAMVLQGRLELVMGNEERAIKLWTDAMAAAVEAAEEEKRSDNKPKLQILQENRDPDPHQLDSPWIELMMLHYERSKYRGKDEMSQCQWAMEIGCEQDDPVSHYYASTFMRREDEDGNHVPTSEWLYHCTKAATSGHQKAMHELGVFYAQSGWKYIEDEPPDHVKPTPFDSYPAPSTETSLLDTLQSLLGISKPKSTKPAEDIFQSAAFPDTALGRWRLAWQWLDESCKYTYAPSFLLKAQLCMQETLWSGANAPQSALNLSNKRYAYASKEDYHSGNIVARPTPVEQPDPPNPYYNIENAKKWLRQVFYAHQAHGYVAKAQEQYASRRRRGLASAAMDEDDIISEDAMSKLPFHIRKWFRFPEVREMYEAQINSLYQEAKAICNEHGWDILEDDGAVIYKAEVTKEARRMAANG